MNAFRPIKSRKSIIAHLLRVMHTANMADEDHRIAWIDAHYDRTHEDRIGLSGQLHNQMSRIVWGLLTPSERKIYDDVGSSEFIEYLVDIKD